MSTNPAQLFLLVDHIKLSLLDRQRAVSLNLSPSSQDGQISRSLDSLRSGIEALETQLETSPDDSLADQLSRLRTQLTVLTSSLVSNGSVTSPSITHPDNPSLFDDFSATQSRPTPNNTVSKSVRFTDDPNPSNNVDPVRAALFPYRDDPSPPTPSQDDMDNQQIHAYHSRVISAQDEQLDQLGASIGRQRELSMQIGDELDGQVLLLDEVEEGVDRHAGQFRRARGRLERVSRKARENWSLSVIVVLIVILVLLIVILK